MIIKLIKYKIINASIMLVFHGISRSYSNGFNRVKRRSKPPQLYKAYFYNEHGTLVTKIVSKFEYYVFKYFKTKYKKRKIYCKKCENVFEGFVKNSRQQVECPFC